MNRLLLVLILLAISCDKRNEPVVHVQLPSHSVIDTTPKENSNVDTVSGRMWRIRHWTGNMGLLQELEAEETDKNPEIILNGVQFYDVNGKAHVFLGGAIEIDEK